MSLPGTSKFHDLRVNSDRNSVVWGFSSDTHLNYNLYKRGQNQQGRGPKISIEVDKFSRVDSIVYTISRFYGEDKTCGIKGLSVLNIGIISLTLVHDDFISYKICVVEIFFITV